MHDTLTLIEVIAVVIACTCASYVWPPFGIVCRFFLKIGLTLCLIALACLTLGVLTFPIYPMWRRV